VAIIGRTLTPHFHIESRQHELFNVDLGEGIPRRMFMFGLFVSLTWVLLMVPILGVPNRVTFSIYLMPPVLFAYFAYQDSGRQPRRKNLTQWAIRARYAITGHRPVVALGGRSAYRSEYLPLSARFPAERLMQFLNPRAPRAEWEASAVEADQGETGEIQSGAAIRLDQAAELIGFDYMQDQRHRRQQTRRTKEKR
jgi:hypothetical protein